jgi:hypothetical protein
MKHFRIFAMRGLMMAEDASSSTGSAGTVPGPTEAEIAAKAAEKAAADAVAKQAKADAKAAADAAKAAEKVAKAEAKAAAKAAKAAEDEAAKAAKVEAAAAEKAAKEKEKLDKQAAKEQAKLDREAAKEANRMPEQNGIRRPKPDTLCGKAWAVFDAESTKLGQPVSIAAALAVTTPQGLVEGNVKAEYARWRKFFGITGRIAAPQAAPQEPAPQAES